MQPPTLSIVIPVHNEEQSLPELWRRLTEVLSGVGLTYEVVFVDDGSKDGSRALLDELCRRCPEAKLLTLSRNFGHQAALAAGINHAAGDAVILMDADLQDRPEAIPDFVREWRDGNEVVYAIRVQRRENAIKRGAFRLFYWILASVSHIRQPVDAGIFCLADRKVIEVVKSMPEKHRYFPGLRAYAGYRQKGVPVGRDARFAGEAQVGLRGLVRLALDAIFAFSYAPIRVFTVLGLIIATGSFVYLSIVILLKVLNPESVPFGIASTLVAVLLIGGLQLTMLGIVGEYIGRIYEELKQRPYYVIREMTNFDSVRTPNPSRMKMDTEQKR